jgi:methylated-DNA-protein-cysteine methyltransferase related protein
VPEGQPVTVTSVMDREEYVEAVLTAVESIPEGEVATYGDIAAYVGQGGPRQVGAVMREYGGGVPWWRVIRASGIPADEVGDEQLQLLRGDGVRVTDGKVDLRRVRWTPQA